MDIHKIDWSAIAWTPVRQGVERKAFSGEGATVALHRLMPSTNRGRTAIPTSRSLTSSPARSGFT